MQRAAVTRAELRAPPTEGHIGSHRALPAACSKRVPAFFAQLLA
jgi:hypothetical protein